MKIVHFSKVKPIKYEGEAAGVEMREVITPADGAPNFAMRIFKVKKGCTTPFHTHAWEHEVFILKGSGFIKKPGRKLAIEKGSVIYIEPDEKHQFIAGEKGVEFICCIPSSGRCTIK